MLCFLVFECHFLWYIYIRYGCKNYMDCFCSIFFRLYGIFTWTLWFTGSNVEFLLHCSMIPFPLLLCYHFVCFLIVPLRLFIFRSISWGQKKKRQEERGTLITKLFSHVFLNWKLALYITIRVCHAFLILQSWWQKISNIAFTIIKLYHDHYLIF